MKFILVTNPGCGRFESKVEVKSIAGCRERGTTWFPAVSSSDGHYRVFHDVPWVIEVIDEG